MHATPKHTCLDRQAFSNYLNGSAPALLKAQIEKHLNLCVPCFEGFINSLNELLNGAMQGKSSVSTVKRACHCA